MIICDVCKMETQTDVWANLYVIPLRMLDTTGQFQIPETFTVDLCARHADDFRARLSDLIEEYGLKYDDGAGGSADPPAPWLPEVGKTYGLPGADKVAFVDMVQTDGIIDCIDVNVINTNESRGNRYRRFSVGQFREQFGEMPIARQAKKGKK